MASVDIKDFFQPKSSRSLSLIIFLVVFTIGLILVFSVNDPTGSSKVLIEFFLNAWTSDKHIVDSLASGLNSTHAWSMRFADEDHFRLARLVTCRQTVYRGGPRNETFDSCDQSATREFSVKNTIEAQKWLYEHQHPINCSQKKFVIIHGFAGSGFGSTIHQILWAFAEAIRQNRIAIYRKPGGWLYGHCNESTPDCFFLPITNCSVPSVIDNNQTTTIPANIYHWHRPIHPPLFRNRTLNWYRAQLFLYVMRFKPETWTAVQEMITQYLNPPAIDPHRPYIAIYVRRSDKVSSGEMSQSFSLKDYFDQFDADARRANIRSVFINSEDEGVFTEFAKLNQEHQGYYKLLRINTTRNLTMYSFLHKITQETRRKYIMEFLTGLYIEVNADLHAGTLSSNWCRMVDGLKLALGKTIAYYTPEKTYWLDWNDPKGKVFFLNETR